jgi:hypothetical protein
MPEEAFTTDQVEALVAKLNAMDFTDTERSILHTVFQAAAGDPEVEGFGMNLGSLQIFTKPIVPPPAPQGGKVKTYDFSGDT